VINEYKTNNTIEMFKRYSTIIITLLGCIATNAQTVNTKSSGSKIQLIEVKQYAVDSIKIIAQKNECFRDSLDCFELLRFNKGLLKSEIYFDDNAKTITQAVGCGYEYEWKDKKLSFRYGKGTVGSCYDIEKEVMKYVYNRQGKLVRNVDDLFTNSPDVDAGIVSNISDSSVTTYTYDPKGRILYTQKEGELQTAYLYVDDNMVGYYPAKDYRKLPENGILSDTIYSEKYIKEFRTLGFEAFSKQYFTRDVYKNLLIDCYRPIKNNELLINGKPIQNFLAINRKSAAQFIILEVADNSFMYFRLID